jgi:hypothetical protein
MLVIAVACWVAITVCTIVVCLALDTRMNWLYTSLEPPILWGAVSHDHHCRTARGARRHPAQAPIGDVATTRRADACVVEPPAIAPAPPPNLHSALEARRSDRHRPRIDKQAHFRVSAASASRIFWMAGSWERFIVSECCRARVVLLRHVRTTVQPRCRLHVAGRRKSFAISWCFRRLHLSVEPGVPNSIVPRTHLTQRQGFGTFRCT